MKLLLLCLGLTLVCASHHDVVECNFDLSQVSGEWYTILWGSEVREMIEENGSMRLFLEYIQVLDNSSVLFKFHKNVNGVCGELTFIVDETKEKGVYGVHYDGYNTFYIIEAVYNEYVIFHCMNFQNGKKNDMIELHARTPDVSPEVKEKFEEICRNRGIQKENILDFTKADHCLQARGSPGAQASSAE
ncbi:allergen Fel d 4 isoform X3 [Desmodus rotundus]|uniref:allergen Fel d 4 isoform X3 n=1 Tax=Desmodus rotundus TaxID=9430 RepID=UPI0023814FE8|nr:allergen Fel d 4-like isoform X3 [Desmodus rotundus]